MNNNFLWKGSIWALVLNCWIVGSAFAGSHNVSGETESHATELAGECGIPSPADEGLYKLNDRVFGYENFVLPIKQSFYELEMEHYHKQKQLIDNALWQNYLAEESKRLGKSVEDVVIALIPPRIASDAEIKAFYEENQQRIGAGFAEVKDQIAQYLAQQQALAMREEILAKLKSELQFELLIDMPLAPVVEINTEGYPEKGNPVGKIEIVEFADYQCPHCKDGAKAVDSLVAKYDDIRVIFMDFPVNRSGISRQVALGGVCAAEQNKFWEYHDMAFAVQDKLNNDSAYAFAESLALDMEEFTGCLESGRPGEAISRAKAEGIRLGVTGTPSFFVNGRKLHAHGDLEGALTEAIEQAKKDS